MINVDGCVPMHSQPIDIPTHRSSSFHWHNCSIVMTVDLIHNIGLQCDPSEYPERLLMNLNINIWQDPSHSLWMYNTRSRIILLSVLPKWQALRKKEMLQVTILLEGFPYMWPHLLHQTVHGIVGCSSLEQGGPFVGCGAMGRELEVLIYVGVLLVYFGRERTIIILPCLLDVN